MLDFVNPIAAGRLRSTGLGRQGSQKSGKERKRHSMAPSMQHAAAGSSDKRLDGNIATLPRGSTGLCLKAA